MLALGAKVCGEPLTPSQSGCLHLHGGGGEVGLGLEVVMVMVNLQRRTPYQTRRR